ncbi:MAG: tRNA lysidine(34) synthetase TilS [candidate division KSB1 bacterium]|nr:tRNA lysidine(34) synthetase TilS [candidate division KSB1 bacterium]MDZ7275306.1 tRNA lysidine(34) synthetase TilS [candidate division KSB1 bacterium]MDZ7287474.1 tRNA lysidine(34) synthetase TilS [candidate division KSB1 bacterium]MDZ7299588.1 tRNA lysidine(34) synthetase TilS [candidate division KSB1 bacterium]MDZ7307474.1 tRNA lysidine(34) synthetase TilS [candidate division KSB1 bacterium]
MAKPAVQGLWWRFRQHWEQQAFAPRGARLLLAVSGGLDSRVMVDLFCALAGEWELTLAIGHVHHQLRGAEADADALFVEALARDCHLPFLIQKVEVREFAREQHLSLEAAARKLRYRALAALCRQAECQAVVTAHTRDDQVETILAHVLRGTGLAGLAGMAMRRPSPEGGVIVLRPLLSFSRRELQDYARERGLRWREDASNSDPTFLRNRLRHELIPLLRTRFQPAVDESLLRLAAIAAQTEADLQEQARQALQQAVHSRMPGKIVLDLQQFWKYFRSIQAYVVRGVMQQLTESRCDLTFDETDRILSLIDAARVRPLRGSRRYLWRSKVEVVVAQTEVAFSRIHPVVPPRLLEIGTRCPVPEAGMVITISRHHLPPDWRKHVTAHSQWIDAAAVSGDLIVRFPQAGDRFRPLGMAGFKKLSDFLIDQKVTRHQRRHIPVVACDTGIIWVCGYRLDERFKIDATTTTVLHLEAERQ